MRIFDSYQYLNKNCINYILCAVIISHGVAPAVAPNAISSAVLPPTNDGIPNSPAGLPGVLIYRLIN